MELDGSSFVHVSTSEPWVDRTDAFTEAEPHPETLSAGPARPNKPAEPKAA